MKYPRLLGIAAVMAFAVCQTSPALAYGPYEEFGARSGVKAMLYFHLPLGAAGTEKSRDASFGFAVKGEFQYAHPAYQKDKGPYVDYAGTSFGLMDFRFGTNGNPGGLDLAGLNALGAKAAPN